MPSQDTTPKDWLAPRTEVEGLTRFLSTLRDRWWVVVLAIVLSTGASLAYLATATKTYEAHADLLVTPISEDGDATLGLGLIPDSNDPTRPVSTAARFVTTTNVARRVIRKLGLEQTPAEVLSKVRAEPVAQSSVVTVTAEADDPERAADLANAFAQQAIADRTAQLRRHLDAAIPLLRAQLAGLPADQQSSAAALAARLGTLEALRGGPDPTISQIVGADPPTGATSPRPKLSLAAGILAGLVLGLGAALAAQAIDPRLRREEQLREIYHLPILARVPSEPRTRNAGALAPEQMSGQARDAYRTLRATLAASHSTDYRSRSILVTGSSPGEGKSTTAINLAHALVQAGNRVILIEADMHRPTIGAALGLRPRQGLNAVLIRQVALEDALVTSPDYGPDLQMLLVERAGIDADRLSLPTAPQLIGEAEALADFVVVDSPPLTEIVDALPLARAAGDVVLAVRLGKSKLPRIIALGEILIQHEIEPAGVVLVGVERSRSGRYYYTPQDSPQDEARGEAAAV